MKNKFGKNFITLILVGVLIIACASVWVAAENSPTVAVSEASGSIGDTVEVTVALSNNPGLVSMSLTVTYDNSALRLVGVDDTGVLPGEMHSDVFSSPYQLTWANDTSKTNYTDDGVLVKLSFKILDTATAGSAYDVEISYDINNYDIYDCDLNAVEIAMTGRSVYVHSCGASERIAGKGATCTEDGWKICYQCSCGKFYEDYDCSKLISAYEIWKITDGEGKISALGHDYSKEIIDAAYLKTAATNCQEANVYWKICSACDASAGNDKTASDKWWTSDIKGSHVFEERSADDHHFASGGTDCRSAKNYYIGCLFCDERSEETWESTERGAHSFKEPVVDDAHFVKESGANCQSAKMYYFDCEFCNEISKSDTWKSEIVGDHSFVQQIEDLAHYVSGTGTDCSNYKEYYLDCEFCETLNYNLTWVSTTRGEHIFTEQIANDKHYVEGTGTNCISAKQYFLDCKLCDVMSEDKTWTSENLGDHSFTKKSEDARYLVEGSGANCQSLKNYYFACEHCGAVGSEAWESQTYGEHKFDMTQWGYADKETGHAHKCLYCSEYDDVLVHVPNIDAPTELEDMICKDCKIVLAEKVVPVVVTVTAVGDIDFTVVGNTVTVSHEIPCKLGYWDETESKYIAISTTANGDGTYSFTVPESVSEVVLVVKGDVDGNGTVNGRDKLSLAKSLLPKLHSAYSALNDVGVFAADIDNNRSVAGKDKLILAKSLLNKTHTAYEALQW